MSQNICLQSQTVIKLEERVIVGRKTTQIVTHNIFLRPTCGLQNDKHLSSDLSTFVYLR